MVVSSVPKAVNLMIKGSQRKNHNVFLFETNAIKVFDGVRMDLREPSCNSTKFSRPEVFEGKLSMQVYSIPSVNERDDSETTFLPLKFSIW